MILYFTFNIQLGPDISVIVKNLYSYYKIFNGRICGCTYVYKELFYPSMIWMISYGNEKF